MQAPRRKTPPKKVNPSSEKTGEWVPLPQVEGRYGVHYSTIYRAMALGLFPKPYHPLGRNSARWKRSELDAHDAALRPGVASQLIPPRKQAPPVAAPPPKPKKPRPRKRAATTASATAGG